MDPVVNSPFVTVFGKEDCEKHLDLLIQFKTIYEEAFPNQNEQENFQEEILPRLQAGEESINLQTIAILLTDLYSNKVVGGMIADWYPTVNSLEIIYIAVEPSARWTEGSNNKHYGRFLLINGTAEICSRIKDKNRKHIDRKNIYVFFEAENPFHPDSYGQDIVKEEEQKLLQEQAVGRLRFFAKCGALRIPINYVQPPLGIDKGFSRNLFLFLLPFSGEESKGGTTKTGIPCKDLIAFINVFYGGLQDRASNKDEFLRELELLRRDIKDVANEKDEVPFDTLQENSVIAPIHQLAVTAHFQITDETVSNSILLAENSICPQWGSYESDLFNYSSQTIPPFSTHFGGLSENVVLPLPSIYAYTSEGRTYCKLSQRNEIKVDVSVSWSVRTIGEKTVRLAHLTLVPHKGGNGTKDKDVFVSEFEVIKIIAGFGFGSKQEHYKLTKNFHSLFVDFYCDLLKKSIPGCSSFIPRHLGCTEINLNGYKSGNNKVEQPARCGILLGIFDFMRMTPVEAEVTLKPLYEFDSLIYYDSRGHLMRVKNRPKELDERLENLLISPYLLIPSAAVCFNEITIEHAQNILSKKKFPLLGMVASAKKLLTTDVMTDIFQYDSEKVILTNVMQGRSLMRKQKQYINLCEMKQAKTVHLMEAIQAMLLAIIALFQIYGIFEYHRYLFWILFGLLFVFFLFYFLFRWKE